MGLLDFIPPAKTTTNQDADSQSVVMEEEIKDQMIPETPTKKQLPKALRDIQLQLNPQVISPSTNKRPRRNISYNENELSPLKKKRVVTRAHQKSQKEPTSGLVSPPVTPSKIVKPAFSLTGLVNSNTGKDPASKKLDFSQPITPPVTPIKKEQQEVSVPVEVEPPKKPCFQEKDAFEDKENVPPLVPQDSKPLFTPTLSLTKPKSIFTRGKAIFQRSYNHELESHLPERQEEAKALNEFLVENIQQQSSTSLYISGPPGTGKTAQIKLSLSRLIDLSSEQPVQVCEVDGKDYKLGYTYINCMTVSKISNIYQEIFQNLTNGRTTISQSKTDLLALLSDSKHADMNIIVLDELDKLITTDQQLLFEIFSWVIYKETKMILIGISNALDMVDRLLPRLKINGLNPNTLSFLPYNSDQIANIIRARLRILNAIPGSSSIPLFHPTAIQLAAKKSSSNTGDLRKAFDICRRAIELAEREIRGDNIFSDGLMSHGTAPLVKINHIVKVCNSVFNNNQSSKLKNLNFLQKHTICLLLKAEDDFRNKKKSNSDTLNMNSFYEYYIKNGKIDSLIGTLKKGEFQEVLATLESIGVIRINKVASKNYSESRVSSSLVRKDLIDAIKGVSVLEQMINE